MKAAIIGTSGHIDLALEVRDRLPQVSFVGVAPGSADEDAREFFVDQMEASLIPFYEDYRRMLDREKPDVAVVAPFFFLQSRIACECLERGIHVFVEKPLCLNRVELDEIESLYGSLTTPPRLMVGFNRRFAPQVVKIQELLKGIREPKSFIMTVNAGAIPPDHWTQNREVGGGRIIGEGCHFIDLLRFLAGAPIVGVQASMIGKSPGIAVRDDKAAFTLTFADGSFGTVHYLATGHKSFPKERLEVFCAGRVLQLDNFRKLRGFGWTGFKEMNLWRQDKGQRACTAAFVTAITEGAPSPIPFEELIEVTRASFDIVELLET